MDETTNVPVETIAVSSDCNNTNQDIDFSQLIYDTPVSNVSSVCNDILGQDFDFSTLFHDIPDTKINPLCFVESVYETNESMPEPVSNTQPASSVNKSALHTCLTCGKIFSRKSHLMRHEMIHERKPTVYTCHVCTKTFPRACYLNQHSATHKLSEESRLYDCPICGKNFSCSSYLNQHKKIHTRGKPFSCEVCLKVFSTKTVLRRHELLHNNNEKGNHSLKCMYCNCIFTRRDHLKQHETRYRNSTYVCTECNQKFCRRNDLKNHTCKYSTMKPEIIQLTKENPYCEKVKYFKRKKELIECSTTTFENCEEGNLDLHTYLTGLSSSVENELKFQFYSINYFKCSFTLEAIVINSVNNDENGFCTLFLNSNILLILCENMITKCIKHVFDEMTNQYNNLNSQWKLNKIIKLDILTMKTN